jgi:hypothetical protein
MPFGSCVGSIPVWIEVMPSSMVHAPRYGRWPGKVSCCRRVAGGSVLLTPEPGFKIGFGLTAMLVGGWWVPGAEFVAYSCLDSSMRVDGLRVEVIPQGWLRC